MSWTVEQIYNAYEGARDTCYPGEERVEYGSIGDLLDSIDGMFDSLNEIIGYTLYKDDDDPQMYELGVTYVLPRKERTYEARCPVPADQGEALTSALNSLKARAVARVNELWPMPAEVTA